MTATRTWTRRTGSPEETFALGDALGRALCGGVTIGLVGPLGAGKTHLVKGIATGNAIDDVRKVTSPTFTLVHEYPGRLTLYHVDVYRLRGSADLMALGFDELTRPDCVVVVEWADRVRGVMPVDALWIEVTTTGDTTRSFRFVAGGEAAARCAEELHQTRVDSDHTDT